MSSNGKNGNGVKWWDNVPPIVPGQKMFSKDQMRLLLGGMSETSYYELRKAGRLKFSRVDKGRQVIHTLKQYLEFDALMNGEYEVQVSAGARPRLISSARAVGNEDSRLGRAG